MSKVVFVGNVPYNMAEEQLIEVFKSAGQVVGFRLVFDRDTGKPKGYGFCEFTDHETALSAVRNLNNVDVGGRALRIDLADSDPFLEGKTTVRGELLDGHDSRRDDSRDPKAFLTELPPGVPVPPGSTSMNFITETLAKMDSASVIEVLAQMKAFVITHPEQARALLIAHPQYGYALLFALLLNNIVDSAVFQRMLGTTISGGPPQHQNQHQMSSVPPPSMHPPFPPSVPPYGVPTGAHYPGTMPGTMPSTMPSHFYRPPSSIPQMPPPQPIPVSAPAPAPKPASQTEITENHQRMLIQVLSLTQEQINALPDQERAAVQQLRTQYMSALTG